MSGFHSLAVIRAHPDAEDAVRIVLAVPDSLADEMRFRPGQHVAVRASIDGEEVRRTYSIVSDPARYELHIVPRTQPGGRMSNYLARHAVPGAKLDVLAPSGGFHVDVEAFARKTYVAFAAGCGITPVYSIIADLLASEPNSRCIVFYGNRTSARAMLLEDLMGLKNIHLQRLSLNFVMSDEPQDVPLWNGRLDGAKVRELAGRVFDPRQVSEYLVCAPAVDEIKATLVSLGVDARHIHSEHFLAARVAGAESQPAAAKIAADETATITVLMDGRRRQFSMSMGNETILDAANAAGFDLPFSCRAGVCSTCRTKVTRGKVQMSEQYALEEWELEAGYVLACSSKPATSDVELYYDER